MSVKGSISKKITPLRRGITVFGVAVESIARALTLAQAA